MRHSPSSYYYNLLGILSESKYEADFGVVQFTTIATTIAVDSCSLQEGCILIILNHRLLGILHHHSDKGHLCDTATTPYEAKYCFCCWGVGANPKSKDEPDDAVNVHLYRSMIVPHLDFQYWNAVKKKIFNVSQKANQNLVLMYPRDSSFVLEAYSDSDYAGSNGDRKSTTGGCQFLGRRLISWQCKKQTIVATSSTEARILLLSFLTDVVRFLDSKSNVLDYGFNFMNTKIFIDNQSTICIVKNPVFHQRTKHIEIRHHFIRDANEKNLIQVLKIHTDDNVADLLTKAFDGPRFNYLVVHIGMLNP
ncbi:hypothetical protein Tco_0555722 [Tanacetum coccineum]